MVLFAVLDNLPLLTYQFDIMHWLIYQVTWCLVWSVYRPITLQLIGLAPRWPCVMIVFLLPWLAPLLANAYAHLFGCVPCLLCYGWCAAIRLQLGLLCYMMTRMVLLVNLAVSLVGQGLEPPIPVFNLLHGRIYCAMNTKTYLKQPKEYLTVRSNTG